MNLTLKTVSSLSNCTLSVLLDETGFPFLKTIERPWLDNQQSISCIPAGIYNVIPFHSPSKGDVFLLQNVPDRTMIEIHVANWASELEGCIAVGLDFTINAGKPAMINSKAALDKLKAVTGYKPFTLTIIRS